MQNSPSLVEIISPTLYSLSGDTIMTSPNVVLNCPSMISLMVYSATLLPEFFNPQLFLNDVRLLHFYYIIPELDAIFNVMTTFVYKSLALVMRLQCCIETQTAVLRTASCRTESRWFVSMHLESAIPNERTGRRAPRKVR